MTQSDLRDVHPSTEGRPGSNQSSRRYVGAAAALAVLAAIGGVAAFMAMDDEPTTPKESSDAPPFDPNASFLKGEPPTAEQLHGVWRVDNDTRVWRFNEDGTFGYTQKGQIYTAPSITGTWALAGDEVTMTSISSDQDGCIGDFFKIRASIPEAGLLRFVQTEVSAAGCSPITARQGVLEHMLPGEDVFAKGLVFSTGPGWEPLSDKAILPGLWMAEGGGGYAMELAPDGEYVVADESAEPVDSGTWTFRGQELALTSLANSVTCNEGDRLVLSGVEAVNLGTDAIRGKVSQNTCDAPWTPAAWFLVPDAR